MQLAEHTHDFASVYRAHHGFVWRTLRHLGVDPGRVDDAVQDTFMVVHRRLGEFAGRAALRTWLFEIARRVAGRYRRTAAREAPRSCEVPELESAARPDDDLARAEAAEILTLFLDELDRDKSVVFIMAELEQRRAPEIAETLDLNLNTVYARLRAARQQLDRLITRLQARERRPRNLRAAHVIAAALLLELPAPPPWTAVPLATATTASLASHTLSLTGLALAAVVLVAALPARDEPPAPRPLALAAPVPSTTPALLAPVLPDTPIAPTPVPSDTHSAPAPSTTPPASTPVPSDTHSAPVSSDTPSEGPRPRPARSAASDDLAAELALIEPARAALLAGDTRTALRLTARHRARFADGVFAQEAAAGHIEALCRAGEPAAATPELAAFQQRWPTSPLHAWLHTVCAAKTR